MRRLACLAALGLLACHHMPGMSQSGPDGSFIYPDAGPFDSGPALDGGTEDGGVDAGPVDAGPNVFTALPASTFSTDTIALRAIVQDEAGNPQRNVSVAIAGTSPSDGFNVVVTTNDAGLAEAFLPNAGPGAWTFSAEISTDGGTQTLTASATVAPAPACTAAPTFGPGSHFAAGSAPDAPARLSSADVDGDGVPDLLIADTAGNVGVALGKGGGTFGDVTKTSFSTSAVVDVHAADFNGDGIPDLAALQSADATIGVALGNGDGTFQMPNPFSTGAAPSRFVVADLNQDGNLDFAATNTGENDLTILFGNADGTFTSFNKRPPTGGGPSGIVAADLNSDGALDLATANGTDGTVTIYLGIGNGTFMNPNKTDPSAGTMPGALATSDLNADGNPDLVATNTGSSTVSVLLGNGDGTFKPPATISVESSPADLALVDVDGDGKVDLVTANKGGDLSVLLGKGDGTFQPAIPVPGATNAPASSLLLADMNNDGLVELLIGSADSNVYLLPTTCP